MWEKRGIWQFNFRRNRMPALAATPASPRALRPRQEHPPPAELPRPTAGGAAGTGMALGLLHCGIQTPSGPGPPRWMGTAAVGASGEGEGCVPGPSSRTPHGHAYGGGRESPLVRACRRPLNSPPAHRPSRVAPVLASSSGLMSERVGVGFRIDSRSGEAAILSIPHSSVKCAVRRVVSIGSGWVIGRDAGIIGSTQYSIYN